ncbi:hypothetical protein EVAR_12906_1 [Eumeta japonica]|uniref:Uncharacterized protein n=1 Tax=Eumeta variegata TaxID=151549 RepID=A0A4C1TVQ8_EUMVA|nr:hypothetical protein EVAR_12906_1 [Eumeta japonica]
MDNLKREREIEIDNGIGIRIEIGNFGENSKSRNDETKSRHVNVRAGERLSSPVVILVKDERINPISSGQSRGQFLVQKDFELNDFKRYFTEGVGPRALRVNGRDRQLDTLPEARSEKSIRHKLKTHEAIRL